MMPMMMDMGTSMNRFFFTSPKLTNFFFWGLDIGDVKSMVAACAVVFFVTALFEALKLYKIYLELKIKQDPLTYSKTDSAAGDRTLLLSPLMIPTSIQQIRRTRLKFHFIGGLTHMFSMAVAYFIMLTFMTYSVWLGLSIVVGSGLGYFVFGYLGQNLIKKYSNLKRSPVQDVQEEACITDAAQINVETPEHCHM